MRESSAVLLSWVARKNDPFEEPPAGKSPDPSRRVLGPTLTLLFDDASPYKNKVGDVVLLYRSPPKASESDSDFQTFQATRREIERLAPRIRVHERVWPGEDPTDHQTLFRFLKALVPEVRGEFRGRELLVHVSPGTPTMHTLWVLMAECGFIEPPFRVVKSYRPRERGSRSAVVEVKLGIESFYKVYRSSRPQRSPSEEEDIFWDPARFRSERLKSLFAEARRYAPLKVPVLILGERGTGKTTLASWLRSHSPFRRKDLDGRWPSVACGQFSGETIKSELFGHKAGAFTDARADKEGLLSAAHGDSLFLDEIGDVSRDVQRLLIRALEERRYTPLGAEGTPPLESDFRLITATNRPLQELQKRLDADFLDRISLFELRMPALREIPEDLPWLWRSVYRTAGERAALERPLPQLSPVDEERILAVLRAYPLPGNLRDLLRLAYRLVALLNEPEKRTVADCVEEALARLDGSDTHTPHAQLRAVASAFSRNLPLDAALPPGAQLQLDGLAEHLQGYVAREISRIAHVRGVPESSLYTGISDRTLRTWKGLGVPPPASGPRKKSSAER